MPPRSLNKIWPLALLTLLGSESVAAESPVWLSVQATSPSPPASGALPIKPSAPPDAIVVVSPCGASPSATAWAAWRTSPRPIPPGPRTRSHRHWFNDNNGVSGHAFIGAVPFLAAAEMVQNPWAKGSLHVCSTFCGLSRMDANAHSPSQVFLGWYLAFASSMAVNKTELAFGGMNFRAVPVALPGVAGMGLEGRW